MRTADLRSAFRSGSAFPRFPGLLLLLLAALPGADYPAHAAGPVAEKAYSAATATPLAATAADPSAASPATGAQDPAAVPGGAEEGFSIVNEDAHPAGEEGYWHRLAGIAGRLHPALTHFPVAWILLAAGLEWAALAMAWRRTGARRFSPRDHWAGLERARRLGAASLIVLMLAAASGVAAAGSGYLLSLTKEPEAALTWHGRLAYATVALGTLALGARLLSRRRGSRAWRLVSALLLAAAAAAVGYAGHLGGSLVYGEGYPWTGGGKP